ncbi:MAG: hypothetical protein HC860_19480 [Alkalinema sp. RU_4_3]|nr:hypothetical protein [Alkalinema sp. RU_4_3]
MGAIAELVLRKKALVVEKPEPRELMEMAWGSVDEIDGRISTGGCAFLCIILLRVSDLDQYAALKFRVFCEDKVSFLSNLVKYTDFDRGHAK